MRRKQAPLFGALPAVVQLLPLLALCCSTAAHADTRRTVSNSSEVLWALQDSEVTDIILAGDVTLRPEEWSAFNRLNAPLNITRYAQAMWKSSMATT